MKTIRVFTAIVFTIFASVPFSFAADTYAKDTSLGKSNLISIDLQDANLKTVLKMFSEQSGLNFIASEDAAEKKVTLYFNNVKVEDALNYIINANNLSYEQEPGTNIFIVKETGKPKVETITKIYELKYAQLNTPAKNASDTGIESIVKGVLSENGKIIADKRTNNLIITDVPSKFPIIENLLSRLDVRTPQVMIRAEILETSTALVESLGIDWSGQFGVYTGPVASTIFPMNNSLGRNHTATTGTTTGTTTGSSSPITTTGTFSMSGVTATIAALLSSSDTKTLARPQIMTMNNETAEININSNDAIETTTTYEAVGNASIPHINPVRADKDERPGITLTVTPTISKSDFITMVIEPKLITKTVSVLFSTSTNPVYDLNFRTAKTTVMVKDGETVVIGGLIKAQNERTLKKVPFFGDIPVLGAAFRYKSKDNNDRELIIFITPNIVKDSYYAVGNVSEREQEKPKAIREKEVNTVLDLFGG